MNKKEVSEIKGLFKRNEGAIDRICGCLIDGEQEIRMTFSDSFLSLSQEEIDKYFEVFKKALSGSLGKNLHTLDYTLDQELSGEGHKRLMQLKTTGLKNQDVLDEFYKSVAQTYHYGESYYVVLIHCNYDVPGRGSDNLEMDDASEEVYEFILCCICPVKLSEAGLCYNTQTNRVQERMRDQWIEAPMNAFLFPAFDDRSTNIHSLLYYTKKTEELHEGFIEDCLGISSPVSFKAQRAALQAIAEELSGRACDYETVCQIFVNLEEMLEENKGESKPLELQKSDVRKLLQVGNDQLDTFDRIYNELVGEKVPLQASNLVKKTITVSVSDAVININFQRADLLQPRRVDGRNCIVIPLDDELEVNGYTAEVGKDEML